MRRYRGFMVDSERWERFEFRSDDIIITTPSKCGTTWMQSIIGSLVLDTPGLTAPVSTISPWFDALFRTEAETAALLEAQTHRRFIKTHTPLDGIPRVEGVTYITVARHPLDVALSDHDHSANQQPGRTLEVRVAASGEPDPALMNREKRPEGRVEFLEWWIDNTVEPNGSGPHGLRDLCQQVGTYWQARADTNVHLFHYSDLWDDLDGEMRRVAEALDIAVVDERFGETVEALTLDSMRSRADTAAPEANLGFWVSNEQFFAKGGRRDWASLLTSEQRGHFEERVERLAGDAAGWLVAGRSAL